MSIKRITISVPDRVAARIKKAAGRVPVSTWITDVIEERLDDTELENAWAAFVEDVAPSKEEARRADILFKRLTKTARKGRAA